MMPVSESIERLIGKLTADQRSGLAPYQTVKLLAALMLVMAWPLKARTDGRAVDTTGGGRSGTTALGSVWGSAVMVKRSFTGVVLPSVAVTVTEYTPPLVPPFEAVLASLPLMRPVNGLMMIPGGRPVAE